MAVDQLASASRANRALEHLNLIRMANGGDCDGKWVAISLADGSSDQRLYASKAEAIRFQLHETQCAYLFWNGIPRLGELRYFLDENENLFDQGFRLADPDSYLNPEFML